MPFLPRHSASSAPSNSSSKATVAATLGAVPASRYFVYGGLALGGFLLDVLSKNWIFARQGMPYTSEPLSLVGNVLTLTTSLNEGALFGIGQGQVALFATASIGAAWAIIGWLFVFRAAHDWWLTIALGGITGGIGGNLYDRLGIPGLTWHFPPERVGEPVYAVRDWIHFKIEGVLDFPVFNIADSLLVCGVALLMWHAFWVAEPSSNAAGSTPSKGCNTSNTSR